MAALMFAFETLTSIKQQTSVILTACTVSSRYHSFTTLVSGFHTVILLYICETEQDIVTY